MPAKIRVYFEGDRRLRPGFHEFFRDLRKRAQEKRCGFRLISAGSGEQARKDFEDSLQTNRQAWSILLIDSEGPLQRRPTGRHASHTFWMVEMMESWFYADKEALADFYGDGFRRKALRSNPRVEEIPKADLEKWLHEATRKCEKKGVYHKTAHAPTMLALIDPALVRQAAPNCARLFQAIETHLK